MGDNARVNAIKNRVCTTAFVVSDNPNADGGKPFVEFGGMSQVNAYAGLIDKVAAEEQVEARLIRAIMYMETTHGWYDGVVAIFGKNKSILPMNINVEYWGNTFGSRADMNDPEKNIRAGARMLFGIKANLPNGSIEKIATLYNNINATRVSDYGARVKKIYDEQPWK